MKRYFLALIGVALLALATSVQAQSAGGGSCTILDGQARATSGGITLVPGASNWRFTGTLSNCVTGATDQTPGVDALGCSGRTVTANVSVTGNCLGNVHLGSYSVTCGNGSFSGTIAGVCTGATCEGTASSVSPAQGGGYAIAFSNASNLPQAENCMTGGTMTGPLFFAGAVGLAGQQ